MWDVIKKIRLGPTYITFSKKSGKDKKVQLGWLPYTKVIEIKDKVNSFAQSKGIDIEIAEFSKE
jgi:ubiquitin